MQTHWNYVHLIEGFYQVNTPIYASNISAWTVDHMKKGVKYRV